MKKPEVTIQYFVDRGRRRTLTFSIQRLNALLIAAVVFCVWSFFVTGFFFVHLFNEKIPATSEKDRRTTSVVSVGPDQPARQNKNIAGSVKAGPSLGNTTLAAKAPEAAPAKVIEQTPEIVAPLPMYTLASLMNFESSLRRSETPDPLRFSNVKITLEGDHLRVSADIEKVNGDLIEGYSFMAAEYLNKDGRSSIVTSHGKKDWESAIHPSSFVGATSFRARILSKKRFDIVHPSNRDGKLVAVRLVAKDKKSGKTIIEVVSMPD